MFGRVRAASSTPYDLELERPPSKLVKDDSFSLYEATLMKLKLGAKRDIGPSPEVSMETETDSVSVSNCCSDALSSHLAEAGYNSYSVLKSSQFVISHEDVMLTDTYCSSASISPSSGDCRSSGSLKQQRSKNESVLYLFAKYRSSGQAASSSQDEMMTYNDGSSVSISPSSSDCQSMKNTKEQPEQDCVSSVR